MISLNIKLRFSYIQQSSYQAKEKTGRGIKRERSTVVQEGDLSNWMLKTDF
jgi:hypothetical protein